MCVCEYVCVSNLNNKIIIFNISIIYFEILNCLCSLLGRNTLSISYYDFHALWFHDPNLSLDFLNYVFIVKQIIISRVFLLIRPYSITVYRFYYQIFIYYIIKQDLKTNLNKIWQHFKNLFSQLQYYTHDLIMSFLLNMFHSMSNEFIIKSTICAYYIYSLAEILLSHIGNLSHNRRPYPIFHLFQVVRPFLPESLILRAFYDHILSREERIVFVDFYKCFKAILSFKFIQIVFTYKWHVT